MKQNNVKKKNVEVILNKSVGEGLNVLLVDHQDSFVHTLANYIRQTGATVTTLRAGEAACDAILNGIPRDRAGPRKDNENGADNDDEEEFEKVDMVVLSPGPGSPSDFKLSATIKACEDANVGVFGVCLGLQGMVEYFGGTLDVLGYPMHGKPSSVHLVRNEEKNTKEEENVESKERKSNQKAK